jgi:hypothetical protein
MDTFAWIWLIAIGATALLLAFYGLARVLYPIGMAISLLYVLAMIYGVLYLLACGVLFVLVMVFPWTQPIIKMGFPWIEVVVSVLLVLLFAACGFLYVRYFRRSPQKPAGCDQDASIAPIWRASSEPNGSKANERLPGEEPRLKMPADSRIGWPDYVDPAVRERMRSGR